jgi:hypothetical protein
LRLRIAIWALAAVLVVLATRVVVYALAPQSVLLAALAHNRLGPDVVMPLVVGTLAAALLAAAVLGIAALTVRERLLLEGRRVVAAPRLRPALLGVRALVLFGVTSFGFAMLESTIHWREGLGWHGLSCLVGPVHRDAIPVLVALSLVTVAVHGALEHLLEWARRLFAQLGVVLVRAPGRASRGRAAGAAPVSRPSLANGPRGPPRFKVPVLCISS